MTYNGLLGHWSSPCKIDYGYVFDSECNYACIYECLKPYRKPTSFSEYVWCNRSSGKWLTSSNEEPCVLENVYTSSTKTIFDPITPWIPTIKYPEVIPSLYQNEEELNSYHSDSYLQSGKTSSNSALSYGLIVAGVVVFMMFALAFRICYAHSVSRRRQQRVGLLAERLNNLQHSSQQRSPGSQASRNNELENHGERLTVLRIRRYICIRILGRGYRQFSNPPEPPPYDVESTPPPSYEETEGLNIPASEASTENNCSQTSEIPEDPPPPYTANIV